MSWQVTSFAVLAAVLLGGFAWYERSRPSSRVVALVAALAALGAAGRVLLSPIPNVVPTTDIALFAGYAIGPAPGFAVGALSALVSNFWLGQGPWTPWQMAAWGLCGLLGAALAAGGRRPLGRIGLAVVCALAGLAYGAILNFSLMPSYGGEISLDRFAALSVRAVPFDLAHAIGNAALALAAGPAMVRMLVRFRERSEYRWRERDAGRRSPLAGLAGVVLVAVFAGAALAPTPAAAAAGPDAAVRWLERAQNPDGGFAAEPGGPSGTAMTGWVMLGLEAAERNPLDVRKNGNSPVDFLRREAEATSDTGDLERTILALEGAGVDPREFAGRNLVAELRRRRAENGSFGGQVSLTAFGVLALRSAGASGGRRDSLAWLRGAQNRDGGWGFVPGAPSDADSTGAALQAVRGSRSARRRIRYLRRAQTRSGGFRIGGSGAVNSQSTAWAIQGIVAAGVDPDSVREDGRSGLDYLMSRQASNGHYMYSAETDQTPVWVTAQVLLAVERQAFPLEPVPRARRRATPAPEGPPPRFLTEPPGRFRPTQPEKDRKLERQEEGTEEGRPESPAEPASAAPADEQPTETVSEPREREEEGDDSGDGGGDVLPALAIGAGVALLVVALAWAVDRRRRW